MKLNHFALILCTSLALGGCVDDPAEVTTTPEAKASCTSDAVPAPGAVLPQWQAWNGVLPADVAGHINSWVLWPLTGQEVGFFKLYQVDLTNKTVASVRRFAAGDRAAVMKALGGRNGALMVIRVPPPVGPGGTEAIQLTNAIRFGDIAHYQPY